MFIQTKVDVLARLAAIGKEAEQTRFYLRGVHVRTAKAGGVLCEVTNGHILAIEHDFGGSRLEGTAGYSAIVCVETIAAIVREAKAIAKTSRLLSLENIRVQIRPDSFSLYAVDKDQERVALGHTSYPCKAFVDGTFPEIERVVPQFDETAVASTSAVDAFNADYIALLANTATSPAKKSDHPFFVLYSHGKGGQSLMRVSGAPNWLGVIMPCRVDGPSTIARPSWYYGESVASQTTRNGGRKHPAQRLAEAAKVERDFANMNVWARCTTGQRIASDSVIESIAREIDKA